MAKEGDNILMSMLSLNSVMRYKRGVIRHRYQCLQWRGLVLKKAKKEPLKLSRRGNTPVGCTCRGMVRCARTLMMCQK